jgi:hypothetical protein
MVLLGITAIAQVTRGGALQRLGLMDCRGGSASKPTASSGGGGTVAA